MCRETREKFRTGVAKTFNKTRLFSRFRRLFSRALHVYINKIQFKDRRLKLTSFTALIFMRLDLTFRVFL